MFLSMNSLSRNMICLHIRSYDSSQTLRESQTKSLGEQSQRR